MSGLDRYIDWGDIVDTSVGADDTVLLIDYGKELDRAIVLTPNGTERTCEFNRYTMWDTFHAGFFGER